MGGTRMDAAAWHSYAGSVASTPRATIFKSSKMNPKYDPTTFEFRESCDSVANPQSTPIILGSDVTGSMGSLAEIIIKKGMGTIILELHNRKPVPDPHLLIAAIGDAECDSSPLQVTQFEADMVLTEQLAELWIEGGGGGNGGESYNLTWAFAFFKTKCDAMLKHKRKGYIFTIGDEAPLPKLTKEQAKKFLGIDIQIDLTNEHMLRSLKPMWHVFHLVVKPVDPIERWRDVLGQNVIMVDDSNKLAEVIVSTIQVTEGHDKAKIADSWDGSTKMTVANAIKDLAAADVEKDAPAGTVLV